MATLKKNALNQVLFTMVDKTDFASIESGALAASMTCKYFGVAHGGSAAATSGAISKAAVQVASGIYKQTIKAAECNFDFLALRWKHVSCADQMMVFEMATANDADLSAQLSDVQSYLIAMSAILSDVDSGVKATQSLASDTHSYLVALSAVMSDIQSNLLKTYSGVWAIQSLASDTHSQAARTYSRAVLVSSDASDAMSAAKATYSRLMLVASSVSDVQSYLVALSAQISDIDSALISQYSDVISKVGGVTATLDDSALSDIGSRVKAVLDSDLSDILSSARSGRSLALLNSSAISDVQSYLVAMSAILSDVDSGVKATQSLASDTHSQAARTYSRVLLNASTISDIQSYLVDMSAMLSNVHSATIAGASPSDLSDILSAARAAAAGASPTAVASRVWSNAIGARVDSRVLLIESLASDAVSAARGVTVTLGASDISMIASQTAAAVGSSISDIQSYLVAMSGALSDTHSQAARTYSRVLLTASTVSDVQSYLVALSAQISDIDSALVSQYSDVISKVGNVKALLDSDLSDILSAARGGKSMALLNASAISDVQSYLVAVSAAISDVHSQAARGYSRLMVVASDTSDALSQATATYSRLALAASTVSDIQSYLIGLSGQISDIDSALTSQFNYLSGAISDVDSALTSQFNSTSSISSDIYSLLTTQGATVSNINSVVTAQIAEMTQGIPPATPTPMQALMYLYMAWRNKTETTATLLKVTNDAGTAIAKATLSDDATTFTKDEFVSGA